MRIDLVAFTVTVNTTLFSPSKTFMIIFSHKVRIKTKRFSEAIKDSAIGVQEFHFILMLFAVWIQFFGYFLEMRHK